VFASAKALEAQGWRYEMRASMLVRLEVSAAHLQHPFD
jgi:hypothetical protein